MSKEIYDKHTWKPTTIYFKPGNIYYEGRFLTGTKEIIRILSKIYMN